MMDNTYIQAIYDFMDKGGFTPFDDETIVYSLTVRDELIDKLNFDDSIQDKVYMGIIQDIEKEITNAIIIHTKHNSQIPDILKDFKYFEYKHKSAKQGNEYYLSKWAKRIVEVLLKNGSKKANEIAQMLDNEGLPSSYYPHLDKAFSYKSKSFYKNEITREGGYWELKNPEKIKKLISN